MQAGPHVVRICIQRPLWGCTRESVSATTHDTDTTIGSEEVPRLSHASLQRSLLPRFTKKMDSTNNHSHIACFWIEASLSVCCWTSLDYIPPSPTPNNKRANFRLYPEKVEKCEFYQGKGDRNISGGTKNNIYYISQTIKSEGKTNIFRHSSQKNIYYLSSVLRN